MDETIQKWSNFFDRCFALRATREEIEAAAAELHAKAPLPGPKLAATLLRPRSASTNVDPLVYICLERLLALKKIDASDVLSSVFLTSKDRLSKTGNADSVTKAKWHNSPDLEEIVFHRLTKGFQTEERPSKSSEGLGTLIVLTRWMLAMVTSHTSDTMLQAMNGIQQSPQQQSINVRDALGMLVVAVVENSKILKILESSKVKGRQQLRMKPLAIDSHCMVNGGLIRQMLIQRRSSQGLRAVSILVHRILITRLGRVGKLLTDRQSLGDVSKAK